MDLITGVNPIASWWLAIILVAVVIVVVAWLLSAIVKTARDIDEEVATVWANGQRVANNTIHIAALYKTAETVEGILTRAGSIAGHSTQIKDHAEQCPSCPQCIWHQGGR
jgi:hypothetical protein